MKILKTPLGLKAILALRAGDVVYISGNIFTARDGAHRKILLTKKPLFRFSHSLVLFHAGPIMRKEHDYWNCISIGPTTSSRMNIYEPEVIKKLGVRAIIGKGGMNREVAEAMRGKCVYLAFPGGCAAIGAAMVKRVVAFHWPELGMTEGVWELKVEKFGPLIVAIDSRGKSLYEKLNKKEKKFKRN